jgi:hypothetical protein
MKIPKQEETVMTYVFEGVKCYIVTRSPLRTYTIYKIIGDDDYKKLKTADTPIEFDKIVEKDRGE